MAVVATKVEAMKDGDTNIAVQTDMVLDPDTGRMLERKTVLAEVLTESGQHKAVIAGQQTRLATVQVQIYLWVH